MCVEFRVVFSNFSPGTVAAPNRVYTCPAGTVRGIFAAALPVGRVRRRRQMPGSLVSGNIINLYINVYNIKYDINFIGFFFFFLPELSNGLALLWRPQTVRGWGGRRGEDEIIKNVSALRERRRTLSVYYASVIILVLCIYRIRRVHIYSRIKDTVILYKYTVGFDITYLAWLIV